MSTPPPFSADQITPDVARQLLRALDAPDPNLRETLPSPAGAPNIPGYTIVATVGSGGGGMVYRAFRDGSDRPVAIKIIRDLAGEAGLQRARRELEMLESLHLSCVPRILDYGVHQGRLYIAEDFVEGRRLDEYADGLAAADLRSRVSLLVSVALAVQTLHERGVIHRDLKPANILVTPAGDIMIVDFGLAFHADAPIATISQTESPIGTPAFIAPEQARGERDKISTRTDVYGLGATAYQVLTGHTPHDTATSLHTAISRVAHEPPREPRTLQPNLPNPLAAILGKACARDPSQRYTSAADLAKDLERWLRGEAVEATTPGVWTRATRWAGRHPKAAAGIGAGVVSLSVFATAGVVGAAAWFTFKGEPTHTRFSAADGRLYLERRSGLPAWEWATARSSEGRYVEPIHLLARLDKSHGGRQVIVLSSGTTPSWGAAFSGMACYDVDGLEANAPPRWQTGIVPPDIKAPPGLHEDNDKFNLNGAILADVFTDAQHPGDEVLATHIRSSGGRSCFRVYELATGVVLFEAWHSGSLSVPIWVPDPAGGFAVFKATSNAHPLASPHDLANGEVVNHATSVFAIRPVLQTPRMADDPDRRGVINVRFPGEDRIDPDVLWYKFLNYPEEIVSPVGDKFVMNVQLPRVEPAGHGKWEIALGFRGLHPDEYRTPAAPQSPRSAMLTIYIDPATGEIKTRTPADGWDAALGPGGDILRWKLENRPGHAIVPRPLPGVAWP
ncbi:MAG: hypothetical protein HBSAPP03_19130 [Phycisphaerae bacterium]|nr:MAG: hypothetical protein HBSAPP03_19130 [Phycisphaerae bacterium]